MPFKGMDESVKRLETKVDRLEKESRAKKDDSRFHYLNLIGFGFVAFAFGVLAWQLYGSLHPVTVLVIVAATLAMIAFNIYQLFRKPSGSKKKERQD